MADDQQAPAEKAEAEELAAHVAREMQKRRIKRHQRQRQAVRLPRFSPRYGIASDLLSARPNLQSGLMKSVSQRSFLYADWPRAATFSDTH